MSLLMNSRVMRRFDALCRAVGALGGGITLHQIADAARIAEELEAPEPDLTLVEDLRARLGLRHPVIDGDLAEARGRAFEDAVQHRVDETVPVPPAWLKALVRRTLRIGGRAIGDIDAAARLPGSDLNVILSCKSYLFSKEYERGEHRAVRNVAARLEDDVSKALAFVEQLREVRAGDNFSIPEDARLDAVVVLPRLLFSFTDECWRRVGPPPGLHRVSSLGEVIRFLKQGREPL